MKKKAKETPWIPCRCGEVWCVKHGAHAFECACPPVSEWKWSPYDPKAKMEPREYPEGHR